MNVQRESDGKGSMWSAEKLAGLTDRVTRLRRRWRTRQLIGRSSDGDSAHRLNALEARIEHLGAQLEGLQDAVHRRAVLEDEKIAELRRRTEPDRLARALSKDARKRGL